MRQVTFVVALLIAAPMATLLAQGPPPGSPSVLPPGVTLLARAPGETPVPGKCLFKEDLDLIAARGALHRTTLNNDAEAPSTRTIWSAAGRSNTTCPSPRSGREVKISGTETVQHVDGCLYEGTTQAKGPTGAFTIKSTIVYDPSAHYMIVLERDSRGLEVLKSGRVGGDSGGYYTHHWQAAPLTVKRTKVRLKGTTFMASPANFRVRTDISEGDGPFVNLGTVWMQRQGTPAAK